MKSWMKFGLIWGVVMFIILNIIFPLVDGEKIIVKKLLLFLPLWLVFGLIFGYISQSRKKKMDKM
ncbi:hypothetical protein LRS05_12600 [Flavobacterium sp. J372]|uniref:hypothetical protein n=1 Tax=Flavobacterium sp. J372 TaxID=2898436 RepID=UPI00215100F4|nr:hypothetical protein [Flavobacterium sp. J372]MCR5862922.1 hypothetical protein [Flavobacterium sp. J372]